MTPTWKTLKEAFETDDAVVAELKLFIDNDGELYRQRTQPIMKNLARKMVKNVYDPTLAVKLWLYLADAGAQKYAKDHGGPGASWHEMFPRKIRLEVAKELAEEFEQMVNNDELDVEELAAYKKKHKKADVKNLTEAVAKEEWDLLEKLRTYMDDTKILEELMRAMSSAEAVSNLEHIMRMWDVPRNDENEDY